MPTLRDDIGEAARDLRARWPETPAAVLAGSGLAGLAGAVGTEARERSERGLLVPGRVAGVPVVTTTACRPHDISLAMLMAAALGARTLVLVLEGWSLEPALRPGDLLLVEDHINLSGANPLVGRPEPGEGPCFLDMSAPYSPALRDRAARACETEPKRGVYLAADSGIPGTEDDRRALRALGADVAGIGGAMEAIAGVRAGLEAMGLVAVSPGVRDRVADRMAASIRRVVEAFIVGIAP